MGFDRFARRCVEALTIGVEGVEGVEEALVLGMRLQFRRDRLEQPVARQCLERALGGARAQHLVVLLDEPGRRGLGQAMPLRLDGGLDRRVEREVEPRRQHDRAQHAHGILLEALVGVADRANHPIPDVGEPADVVDDRAVGDVVEEGVDGEVTPEGILFGGAEGVVAMDLQIALAFGVVDLGFAIGRLRRLAGRGRHVLAERRHLDGLVAELHVREPEPPADDPAVPEQLLDLIRMRRGADVEVLGPAAEQQIAHAAADEIRGVVRLVQPREHLERIGIDETSAKWDGRLWRR